MDDQSASEQRHVPAPLSGEEAAELLDVVGRARKGDHSAVPRLREILAARPHIWQHYGNLGLQVRLAWIALAAGPDLHLQECLRWRAADLHRELVGTSTSPVVRLMAERVVLAWLQACYFDGIEVAALRKPESLPLLNYRAKRGTQAGRQYLMALAAFATLRKLLPDDVATGRTVVACPPPQRVIEAPKPGATLLPPVVQSAAAPAEASFVVTPESVAQVPQARRKIRRAVTTSGEPVTPIAGGGSWPEQRVAPRVQTASAPPSSPPTRSPPKSKPRRRRRPAARKVRRQQFQPSSAAS